MKKLKKYRNSGETLVEVLVCAVLFLMMAAVMQGAIVFCTNAWHKSEQIRENNADICRSLREKDIAEKGKVNYSFKATSMDGNTEGDKVFTIEVPQGTKSPVYTDAQGNTQTVLFYLYGPVAEPAGGGGTGGGGS